MNILILIDVVPPKYSGMTLRIEETFRRLAGRHALHFLYIGNEKITEERQEWMRRLFVSYGNVGLVKKESGLGRIKNVLFWKHGAYAKNRYPSDYQTVKDAIAKIVSDHKIDCIHVFGCFSAQYASEINGVRKVWDLGDSYSLDIQRQMGHSWSGSKMMWLMAWRRLLNYELEMFSRFDRIIFVSRVDASIYKKYKFRNIEVIPNGVDTSYFSPSGAIQEDYPSVIFTGHMSFLPNIQAVLYFYREIYGRLRESMPNLKFYVVGADPSPEIKALSQKQDVVVTGRVDDIRPFLQRATVFVNPMVSGAGIKNKVLQTMAMAKPIVTTSLGVEAIEVSDQKNISIAHNPQDFFNRTMALLNDHSFRMRMGENARKLVVDKYSWEMNVGCYEKIYKEIHIHG